jgi:hypothetical protein
MMNSHLLRHYYQSGGKTASRGLQDVETSLLVQGGRLHVCTYLDATHK